MTILLSLVVVAILYGTHVSLAYLPIRNSGWYFPLGVMLAMLGNLIWLSMVRHLQGQHILFYSLAFDTVITLMSVLVPIFILGIPVSPRVGWGIAVVVLGIVIIKGAAT